MGLGSLSLGQGRDTRQGGVRLAGRAVYLPLDVPVYEPPQAVRIMQRQQQAKAGPFVAA